MNVEQKNPAFRMMFLITTPKLADKAAALFREGNVPVQHHFRGQGTATSEIMHMLGLDSVEKTIIITMMPKMFADEMLKKLRKRLHLWLPDTGVAFTVPMSGGSGRMLELISALQPEAREKILERSEFDMAESSYSMIMTIVNQGYSEEVMKAARPVGASGGTVFHCRRLGSEEAMKFWGIQVQQEREIIIILAEKEAKREIMQAICKQCGMKSEANGVVFSLPVDEIIGLS